MSNDSQMFCHLANPNYLKLLNLLGLQFDSSDLEDFDPYKNCNMKPDFLKPNVISIFFLSLSPHKFQILDFEILNPIIHSYSEHHE